jgi:hypothetical protein
MSTRLRKNKRLEFGVFKKESEALAECEKRKPLFPNLDANFLVRKMAGRKSGKREWLAYCLIPKKGR